MALSDPRLLTPPKEEEEIHPYRRVWRSILIECLLLLGVTGAIIVFGGLIPSGLTGIASTGIALLPALLWVAFSLLPERRIEQPREQILFTFILSALAAQAVGVPLLRDFFRVEVWLPTSPTLDRILGYTFTAGIVQEFIKYIILRYIVYPGGFRYRLDVVAYAAASAVAYATIINLHFVVEHSPAPDIAAVRVFSTLAQQLMCSAIVAYGLAQSRFSNAIPVLLAFTFALAALVTGIIIPFRAGLTNAAFVAGVSGVSPLRSLALSAVALALILTLIAFLIENAERRDQEAAAEKATEEFLQDVRY